MDIPGELVEQLRRGNVVLFCGAGISVSEGGLPSGGQLAKELAERAKLEELKGKPLPEVAQAYQEMTSPYDLIDYITRRIKDAHAKPFRTHSIIAELPYKYIVTTNWDTLLEEALQRVPKDFQKIVRDSDLSYIDQKKVLLIKSHGCIEQRDTIVVADDDYYEIFNNRPLMANALKHYFATMTVLFLGFGLADVDFRRLYREIVRGLGRHQRPAYAVLLHPPSYMNQYWQQNNVKIIAADVTTFLETIKDQLSGAPNSGTPKTAKQWLIEGKAYTRSKQYDKALEAIEQAIQLDPDNEEAHYSKGYALVEMHSYQEALAALNRAIELNPNNERAYYSKGFALVEMHSYQEALTALNQATDLNPKRARAYYSKGYVLHRLRRYAEAVDAYDQCIRLDPEYAPAYRGKGDALNELGGREAEVKEAYQKYYELIG